MNFLTDIIKYPAVIVNAAAMHFYILHKNRAPILALLRKKPRPLECVGLS